MSSSAQAEGADIRVRDVAVSEDELTVVLMDGARSPCRWPDIPAWLTARPSSGPVGSWPAAATASTGRMWTRTSRSRP